MIAVGSDDASLSSGGKVQIQEYNEASRFAISFHFIVVEKTSQFRNINYSNRNIAQQCFLVFAMLYSSTKLF